ncbi:pyridine nucleotide-disulfide oxidoreductase [Rhodoferax lacus]|uniref:Pyridine nucleotide-disulfide oxidoreductase n=1 Tax=Rhodoferax lacus TaxID=2184758 RepID=A0A3E1RE76_9BURK|nr:bifunctional TVP38/TMEM64 family protein/FAD-dependent oxidoreductase [Rhodoferax lacus]RFO97531.1 pyridine nucleotide-disulfide oxidoreductase [Rhodoferax lacus]
MKASRWLLLGVLAAAVALFFGLGLHRYLSLATLQQRHAEFAALYAQHPWDVRAGYFLLYLAVASLSLPGAAILTLAGGAVFGFGWGLLLTSFASSLGATLSFWLARWLLRDLVQSRFAVQLQAINAGLQKEGALYLFGLRLIPVVPFFLINLTMGLTALRSWTFYWVSQLGMLVGTAVYVNAGLQLASLQSLSDVASPALLGSLVLLGLFPLLVSAVWKRVEQRRVYAPWRSHKPKTFERNLVVIGAGAGGLVSAYIAAAVRAKVTLVEAYKMGGDCLNYGCVPSKALIRTARVAQQMRKAGDCGLQSNAPVLDFKALMQRINQVVADIAPHDSVERYTALGVDVVQGYATITSPWTVEVALNGGGTRTLTTRSIVVAAGAQPVVPPLPGLADVGYQTSDTLWAHLSTLDSLPKRWVVLGGGPIGCELAQAFARLGAEVTQVEMADRLLLREDDEVSALAQAALQADGVQVLTGHKALRCALQGERKVLVLQPQGPGAAPGSSHGARQELHVEFDLLLCAVGRSARLTGYGLEALGVDTAKTVLTDAHLQTVYPNIYAAGDVAGPYQFTHVAAHQAWYATVNALFGDFKRFKVNYRAIPQATFTDPEMARVGLNEREATDKKVPYEVTRFDIAELDRAIADGTQRGWVKVLTVPGKDRILGVTIVGAQAAELLAEYVLAMQHGLGLNKILGTVHSYPTLAEANKYAAGQWRRAHQPEGLLRWAQRFHAWRRG